MKDYRRIITDEIRSLTGQWLNDRTVPTVRAIGDGMCEEFAQEILDRIHAIHPETTSAISIGYTDDWWVRERDEQGNDLNSAVSFEADIPRLRSEGAPLPDDLSDEQLSEIIGQATHAWITWDDLHFDATAPEGERHFLLMPFFSDQIAGFRQSIQGVAT